MTNSLQVQAMEQTPATELTTASPLSLDKSPELVVKQAHQAAKQLSNIVEQTKSYITINGKKHLFFEAWQTIGAFHGVTADIEWSRPLRDSDGKLLGFEARAFVHNPSTGVVLTHAEAECRYQEKNWSGRDQYALRSMCQTRAMAKALRNVLAWQVVLAGYKPTPAEEMEAIKAEERAVSSYSVSSSFDSEPKESAEVDPKAKQIDLWMLQMTHGDPNAAGDAFEKITEWTNKKGDKMPGKRSATELNAVKRPGSRMSQLDVNYGKIEKLYKAWEKTQPAETVASDATPPEPELSTDSEVVL